MGFSPFLLAELGGGGGFHQQSQEVFASQTRENKGPPEIVWVSEPRPTQCHCLTLPPTSPALFLVRGRGR